MDIPPADLSKPPDELVQFQQNPNRGLLMLNSTFHGSFLGPGEGRRPLFFRKKIDPSLATDYPSN